MAMKNTGRPKDATNPLSHGAKPVYCRRFGGIHDQDAWAPNEIANGQINCDADSGTWEVFKF